MMMKIVSFTEKVFFQGYLFCLAGLSLEFISDSPIPSGCDCRMGRCYRVGSDMRIHRSVSTAEFIAPKHWERIASGITPD